MKVITAVENYERQKGDFFIFLAGGITKCWEWQKAVIEELQKKDLPHLVLFNPRRDNFPINDPNASEEQIKWEFKYLEQMDAFSMYFCGNTESDQPICFYELGRNVARLMKYPGGHTRIAVTCEGDFRRKADVVIQTDLATRIGGFVSVVHIENEEDRLKSAKIHADAIAAIYYDYNSIENKAPESEKSQIF